MPIPRHDMTLPTVAPIEVGPEPSWRRPGCEARINQHWMGKRRVTRCANPATVSVDGRNLCYQHAARICLQALLEYGKDVTQERVEAREQLAGH
jgi:hypothetical protein